MTMTLADPALLREHCLIDGVWTGTPAIAVTDPATDETLARVPDLGTGETRAAIAAAKAAMPAWAAKTAGERARILRKWFDLMMAHQEDLATILTREQGKSLTEAKGEIAYAASSFVEWFAEEAKRVYGDDDSQRRSGGQPHRGAQAAGRGGRGDHAVELPQRDDHAQGGRRAGGRLHHRHQAGLGHALLGAGPGTTRGRGRHSRPACSTW
jgi:hypothetical protein